MLQTEPSKAAVEFRTGGLLDAAGIRRVNTDAFGRTAEANLVDVLRRHWQVVISTVAELDGEIVAHVVLTQVTLMPTVPGLRMVALGPVAVLKSHQARGIGSSLIKRAIADARTEGWQAIVVVGPPQYYKRFGFIEARRVGLRCEFMVPDEGFMVLELQAGILEGLHGVVRYQPEFSGF